MGKDRQKKKMSKGKKAIVIVAFVLVGIIALYGVIRLVDFCMYADFYVHAKAAFAMPGTASGYVGQGFDYLEDEDAFLTCGYSSKGGKASMVYYIDSNGKSHKTELLNENGSNYTGHTGGIAHYDGYVYITGDDGLDVFNLEDFTEKRATATQIGEVSVPEGHDPAFVTVHDGYLYEGDFYREGNYETPDNERITTPSGDNNTAIIYAYKLNSLLYALNCGVSYSPEKAYSIRGLVQGVTFTEDKIVLSTSWGMSASHLYFYDIPTESSDSISLSLLNKVPLYYLDGSNLTDDVKAPPMSEEMVYHDGRLYIMTESASNKYIFGKLTSGLFVRAYKV